MKSRQNPFRISALNSLKVHQVRIQDQKQLINTFKGANDLRKQLNKNKNSSVSAYKQTLQNNTKLFSQTASNLQKPQSQALMDEVAALDNFKVPVTREKTKNLIENIKLRRRQKHIQAYNNFKEDLDDYKQNLLQIYESLYNDCFQVLSIKQGQLSGYFRSQTDQYLLSREKIILKQFQDEFEAYRKTSEQKLLTSREELQRIKNSRGSVVDETCEMLRIRLVDIAFVLQDQAREIQKKEKQRITNLEEQFYSTYLAKLAQLQQSQKQKSAIMQDRLSQVTKKWRQLKQQFQISHFESSLQSLPYKNSQKRQNLYNKLIKLQEENHAQKKKYLESLIMDEHVDSFKKHNLEKWFEVMKAINDDFDKKLDTLVKDLMDQLKESKDKHQQLIMYLEERLRYIQNHNSEQITQMVANTYQPMVDANNTQAQETLKSATSYVQLNDQKQNILIENLYKFFGSIGQNNDDFVKEFTAMSQKYQIQKAKILDDDQELIQKLNAQLEAFKKQLRESLHHIKLQEVEKKCFQKIDQIEVAYRKTHQNNKQLSAVRPQTLSSFMQSFQAKMALIFSLYEESKRNQLVERNKQDAQKMALKRIQQEDKKKQQEEEKQLQLIKKNGGKAPPAPKPKDPKKVAAQIEQRKKAILTQMGQKKIQQIKTGSGNTWLVYKSVQAISKQFYKVAQQEGQANQNASSPPQQSDNTQAKTFQVDQLPQPVMNSEGQAVTTRQTIFKIEQISQYLLALRDKIFANIDSKKSRILNQTSKQNEQMMQESLTMLDDRLKRHYSLKGQLQTEIFVKRSGQITNHKKRYEKYARTIRQKMDLQTERFNFLLEKSLEHLKQHNTAQKQLRQQLLSGKNLSELQGMLSKARQNYNKFTQEINQIVAELNHLSKTQVDILLQKNKDFIKESKLIKDGGEYSDQEIKWYMEMMAQITNQIKTQQSRREQKCTQIQTQCEKCKKQLLDKIQKDYYSSIEELSAKDGTGKIYGKPKRIAQQKLRLQMNKCEQSQISIDKQIDDLIAVYQKEKSHAFKFNQKRPETLKWRKQLMTLWTCIDRYAKHLQALKKDLKIKPMPRVNYDENVAQCSVGSAEEDKKLIEQEMKELGPLGEQKEEKAFSRFIIDIEKIISDESRTVYIGDKAKYLTGADKIPDFLRKYIATMKQSAEDFRQNSIRELRQSCMRLSELCDNLNQLFMNSIESYFSRMSRQTVSDLSRRFGEVYGKQEAEKGQNLRMLRPNLANPKCQSQLKTLNQKQLVRQAQFLVQINSLQQQFKNTHFANGRDFITCLINNYEFLLFYCDSIYLFEDFVKVVGDDDQDKKKLNIKKLMAMKQKGISVDSSSERNLTKKWPGINFTLINFDSLKFAYKKVQVEDPAIKDPKKAAKKDAKKPSNQAVQQQVDSQTSSRQIQTFKTWRQKGVFERRQRCLQGFVKGYTEQIADMYLRVEQSRKETEMFTKKWSKIVDQLSIK